MKGMSHDHMKPEVTVGIVVLNREWIIGEAIRSLLTQDYPSDKVHVIIVDGGSTDNTVEICTKMLEGSSVASFGIIVKPSTIPEARNICISKMKGSYLFFWDSDVIMGSRALSELVDAAERVHADIVSKQSPKPSYNIALDKHKNTCRKYVLRKLFGWRGLLLYYWQNIGMYLAVFLDQLG